MRPRSRPLALACLALTPACQLPQGSTSSFTTNVMLTSATSTGDDTTASSSTTTPPPDTSTTTAASTTPESTSDPGPVLDVGTNQDAGPGAPAGCKGKIDFLFVISRYGVMQYYQQQLLDAFPAFIDTIEDKFADFDYHIMVVDGDADWGDTVCDEKCPAECTPGYPCDYAPDTCDRLMGTGTVYPAGYFASNKDCGIAGNRRYLTKEQPNLKETFTCVARIGTNGGYFMGEALTAAVNHNLNGPGGCNGGFLRKDALLMVTLLSSNYDSSVEPWASDGTPETWHAAVLAAKGNDPEAVVVLNILDTAYAPGCHPEDRICQMTKLFPYSLTTDHSVKEYASAFAAATDLVETACAAYVPPN